MILKIIFNLKKMDVLRLFYKELPKFDGKELRLTDVELINYQLPYNNIGNEQLLFHGAPLNCLDSIVQNGFNLDNKSMAGHIGNGIYFSDLISQCIYYQLKYEYNGDEDYFKLLVCKVALGNCIKLERSCKTSDIDKINGYDSHMTDYEQDGKKGHEYCIFNSDQILPYCFMHMIVK
jgi:hypothetical protein